MNDNAVHDAILWANEAKAALGKMIENLQQIQPPQPILIAVPWVGQNTARTDDDFSKSDCGAACVTMLLHWRGGAQSVDDVSRATGLSAGYTAAWVSNLIAAAVHFGLSLVHQFGTAADPIGTYTLDLIKREIDAGRPSIALVNYPSLKIKFDASYKAGHFVVLTGYDPNNGDLFYNDPYWLDSTGLKIRINGIDFAAALANCKLNGNRSFQGLTVKHE